MSTRFIIGLLSFCAGMSGVMLGNMLQYMMIGEINRKRPEGDLISYVGFGPAKIHRIHKEYRRLYPDGQLHIYTLSALALQMIGFISVGLCLLTAG